MGYVLPSLRDSRKCRLSLVRSFTTSSNTAAKVKAMIKKRHGIVLSAFIGFFFAYENLNLTSQKVADGN